jgi:hypothetical protein
LAGRDRQGRGPQASAYRRRTPEQAARRRRQRTIAETRRYLDNADALLRTENSAVDFFNAKIEKYPNHLGRTVPWAGASALYGVREHPGEDVGQILVAGWL